MLLGGRPWLGFVSTAGCIQLPREKTSTIGEYLAKLEVFSVRTISELRGGSAIDRVGRLVIIVKLFCLFCFFLPLYGE